MQQTVAGEVLLFCYSNQHI